MHDSQYLQMLLLQGMHVMDIQMEDRIIAGLIPIISFLLWTFSSIALILVLVISYLVFYKVTFYYVASHITRFADAMVTAFIIFISLVAASLATSVVSSDAKGVIPAGLPELFYELSVLISTLYFLASIIFLAITGFMGKTSPMLLCIKPFQSLYFKSSSNKSMQPITKASAD